MPRPTLRQLEYFISAARLGTFASAASAHHIAQPSLSEQISLLERSLKVKLFTRTSRKLLLTDPGKQLLPLAERTVGSAGELTDWSHRLHSVDEGTVSFGTFNSAHLYLLTDVVREFYALHPRVRINILGLNSADVADAVRSGRLEAGLLQLPIDDRELTVIPTSFKDPVVYASTNPKHTQTSVDIRTLVERPMILSEARWAFQDPLRVTLREQAQSEGLSFEPLIEVEFQTHALELAAQGVGDCLVSYHAGKQLFKERGLTWAPLNPNIREHYAFVTRKNGILSPATRAFMEVASQSLQELTRAHAGDLELQSRLAESNPSESST